jgi:GTP cyclohydrolase I
MIMVRDIELYSLCEHHMLPFFGKAHVAYIPNGKIVGLSKIPRIVDVYARRLQVQERLTEQIADGLCRVVNPSGVGVVIEAYHLCMMMRGVQKQNSKTITSRSGARSAKIPRRATSSCVWRILTAEPRNTDGAIGLGLTAC